MGAADRRNRFPESRIVRVDEAQIRDAEIGHGARRGADVQRVSDGDEYDGE
jgi:hypothetical protein